MQSEQILAAARAAGGHLVSLHAAAVQEHERGTHGWQLEWLSLGPLLRLAAGALRNAEALLGGVCVYPQRMRENLTLGLDLALSEGAVTLLSQALPRPEAQSRVRDAALRARTERRSLLDVLRESITVAPAIDWSVLTPEASLGHASALIDRLIAAAARRYPA
jgi:3-carboxy-cis,cis-muconate cycloisomerase